MNALRCPQRNQLGRELIDASRSLDDYEIIFSPFADATLDNPIAPPTRLSQDTA